ncbi:uncharacterized protein [Palaemon carinicauda]|uniref:uncharacterized protein n=1 Tax=Palaemon carinicauda TaxID=392227 RepID=UPI0035B5844F
MRMKISTLAVAGITGCLFWLSADGREDFKFESKYLQPQESEPAFWMARDPRNDVTRQPVEPHEVILKTNADKINALRGKMLEVISNEAKQLSSNNQSIVSIAFLAFGVILFDVLTDAIFGDQSNLVASLVGGSPHGRETMLPGLGLFGDNLNNLAEVVLNMLTIYMYRDESPDCGERLLCESNQQAVSRGFLDSLVTYVSGFSVSFFLRQAPVSQNLEAMRAGRKGQNCMELYPKCAISL